jgi:hypothetical protein
MHSRLNLDVLRMSSVLSSYPSLPSTMHSHVRILSWPSIPRIPGSSSPHSRRCALYPCPSSWSPLSRIPDMLVYCQCILVFVLRLNFEFLWHTSATSFSYSPSSMHSHITAIYLFNLLSVRSFVLPTHPPLSQVPARHPLPPFATHATSGGAGRGRGGVFSLRRGARAWWGGI